MVAPPGLPVARSGTLSRALRLSPRIEQQPPPPASPVAAGGQVVAVRTLTHSNSASALRHMGKAQLVERFADDESEFALRPNGKGRLSVLVHAVAAAKAAAIPLNTSKQDDNGVRCGGV